MSKNQNNAETAGNAIGRLFTVVCVAGGKVGEHLAVGIEHSVEKTVETGMKAIDSASPVIVNAVDRTCKATDEATEVGSNLASGFLKGLQ